MKSLTIFITLGLLLVGGTYIFFGIKKKITAINAISCYSGGTLIYQGQAKGRIVSGLGIKYTFDEAKTGKEIRVSGNCIIQESQNSFQESESQ